MRFTDIVYQLIGQCQTGLGQVRLDNAKVIGYEYANIRRRRFEYVTRRALFDSVIATTLSEVLLPAAVATSILRSDLSRREHVK